jgi:hypothetical protein
LQFLKRKNKTVNPVIAQWTERVETEMGRMKRILEDVPSERLNRTPSDSDWSSAQHIEHLIIVTNLVCGKIEEALKKSTPPGDPADWKANWLERQFIAACGPQPAGRTNPAPGIFIPGSGPFAPDDLKARFLATHQRLLDLLCRADEVDIRRVMVASAALPLLRLRLGAWLEAMAVHVRYHTDRAESLSR